MILSTNCAFNISSAYIRLVNDFNTVTVLREYCRTSHNLKWKNCMDETEHCRAIWFLWSQESKFTKKFNISWLAIVENLALVSQENKLIDYI